MGEPRAVTYKEVEKASGNEGSRALWDKIGDVSGAGHIALDMDGNASINLTDVSDAKRSQIDKLLKGEKEEKKSEVNK